MSQLKDLMEKRKQTHEDATKLLQGEQTAETRTTVDKMFADIDEWTKDIDRIQRSDKMAEELRAAQATSVTDPAPTTVAPAVKDPKVEGPAYRAAWRDYMTNGETMTAKVPGCKSESRQRLLEVQRAMLLAQTREQRDQLAGTQSITYSEGAAGGYFTPAGFVYDVDVATKFYAPLVDGSVLRIMETATGNVLPYPTSNDTEQAWTVLGEAAQVQDAGQLQNYPTQGSAPVNTVGSFPNPGNVTLGSVSFGAYKGTTGNIRVSYELLQDSAFGMESFLADAFAVRLGRGYEYYLTKGTGSNQPLGIIPAIAASGATAVTAVGSNANSGISGDNSTNSIGSQDLVNLEHSIDPTYRKGAKYMFNDATLQNLKTRLDKFGRPLWVPSVREGEPDRLNGYEYVINQSMAKIAASATVMAFGAWKKFIVRKVKDLTIQRLDERYADFGEVAFLAFSRIDSKLIDAGTHPLNVLQMHS